MRSWQKVCAQRIPANSGREDILRQDTASTLWACSAASPSSSSMSWPSSSSACCARSSASTARRTGFRSSTSASAACVAGEPVTTTGARAGRPRTRARRAARRRSRRGARHGAARVPGRGPPGTARRRRRGRHAAHRLLRGVRARRGRPARRPAVHRALEERRRAAGTPPGGGHRPGRAVRRRREPRHERRHGRRHRRGPAPGPPRARQRRRQRHRAPHGRATAARRRPAPVRRAADPAVLGGRPGPDAGLGAGEPARRALGRRPRPPRPDVGPQLRAPVRRRDRHHPAPLAHPAARAPRPAAARGHRPGHRRRGTALRLRRGGAAAPPLPQGRRGRPGRLPPHLPRGTLPGPWPWRPADRAGALDLARRERAGSGQTPTARRRHDERASPGGGGGRRARPGSTRRRRWRPRTPPSTSTSWTASPLRTAWCVTASRRTT